MNFNLRKGLVGLLACLQTASAIPLDARQLVVVPDEDSFYSAPAGLNATAPGTILRSRPVPFPIAAFNTLPANLEAAYQILYRTTDSHGNPEAAMTTLLVPHNAQPSKLLSYQIAQDAPDTACAPSYVLQLLSTPGAIISQAELLLIEAALDKGWYVVTPDYQGPQSAYVAGIQSGQATLDSVRAALQSQNFSQLSPDATVTLWCYSWGALASNWAVELQPSYAPELSFAGATIGGAIPNIQNVMETINNGPFAGLSASGVMGLYNEYPNLAAYLEQQFVPATETKFKSVRGQCLPATAIEFAFNDMFSYFKSGNAVIQGAVPQEVLKTNTLGQHVPTTPLYFYKSINDEVSPIADTDKIVSGYCAGGASVQYQRDLLSEHGSLAVTGAPEAMVWLEARMNGTPAASGCSTNSVISTLENPAAIVALGELVVGALAALLGAPIGPLSIA